VHLASESIFCDVFVEGDLVGHDFDMYKEARNEGYRAYIVFKTDVVVDDGLLAIDFYPCQAECQDFRH